MMADITSAKGMVESFGVIASMSGLSTMPSVQRTSPVRAIPATMTNTRLISAATI